MTEIRCEVCGEAFERPHTMGPKPRHCPKSKCRMRALRQRQSLTGSGARVTLAIAGTRHDSGGPLVTRPGGPLVTPSMDALVTAPADPSRTPGHGDESSHALRRVAALYVRADGPYPPLPGVDAWDLERDATRYEGPHPVVAHPPCSPWGIYRRTSTQRADLAIRAVQQVQRFGGVLEHPAGSRVWLAMELPGPGDPPGRFGGWTLSVSQCRWGHETPKPTWLYIVGTREIPELPPHVDPPPGRVRDLDRRDRETTPPDFAAWLVEVARRAAGVTSARRGDESGWAR